MLIESAFQYLPEILCGSNYKVQDYEAGITNAMSLALLQELNARNVANPLGALLVELLYSKDGYPNPNDTKKKRHDRCDLFVDLIRMNVANDDLAKFGWRHRNYMEAKFFRRKVKNSTNNAADLLADLIRLCCLVPPQRIAYERWKRDFEDKKHRGVATPKQEWHVPYEGKPNPKGNYEGLCVGRYLLHVYLGNPEAYLGQGIRTWTEPIRTAGPQDVVIGVGKQGERDVPDGPKAKKGEKQKTKKENPEEGDTFIDRLSVELKDLKLTLKVTNRVIEQQSLGGEETYTCVLTRIDEFTVEINGHTYSEKSKREGTEGKPGDWLAINMKVGSYLNLKPKTEQASEEEKADKANEDQMPMLPPDGPQPTKSEEIIYSGATGGAA
jgi:hypothetical protein